MSSHLQVKNKPHKTPLDPAYIAGFMDGDGSVYISGDTARLNFTQCDPHVLIRIQEEYGGRIHVRRMPDNGPKRSQYSLGLSGWDAHALCLVMLPHLRVKAHVVTLFIRFFDFYRLPDTPEKQALAKAVKEENGRNTRSAIAPLPAISHAYLAGIIDAEGCMRKETIKISQKSDPVLLRDIHATYGGRTRDVCVEFYRQDQRRSILDAVKPHLIVKRDQAEVSLRILDGNTDPALVKKLAELKRVRHELSDADIKALNAAQKDGRTRAIRNDPSNTARLAANQAAARRQAEKGPVNGGVRTEEAMRKAMKTTYSRGKTRRKITDDQIDEVRERLAENPNMRRVAKTMGLHVAQVSDIRDGKLLKLKDLQAAKDPVALNAAAKAAARPRKRTDTSVLMTRASRILGGNNNRDLSDEQILQVRTELSRPGAQQKIIAQQLGISAGLVGKVRQGELQTADEVRAEMRQNGIPVDPCFAIKADGTVTEYNDPWDAAKVLGVPNKKVIKALMEGEGTPFKDRLWYSSREAMETEEATKAQAAMFQVFQVDTKRGNKRVIARFQSYSEAAKAAGIQMASVSSAARLNYETPAGMRWFNSRARAEAFVGEIEMHLFLELV